MTVVPNFLQALNFIIRPTLATYVTAIGSVIFHFFFFAVNHPLLEILVENIFYIDFQPVEKFLRSIVFVILSYMTSQQRWVYTIINRFYAVTKRTWGVSLVLVNITVIWIRLASIQQFCESLKIRVNYKRNPHRPVVISEFYFFAFWWQINFHRVTFLTIFLVFVKRIDRIKTIQAPKSIIPLMFVFCCLHI